jgi:predicted nucleic acid-binding protein
VKYLLDVNALIALGHSAHVHHARAVAWYLSVKSPATSFCTCAITELGFVRVTVQIGLQHDVAAARQALAALKRSPSGLFEILGDSLGAEALPSFARTPNKLTDGHLLALARHHGVQLATLDTGIPGSLLLP